MQVGCGYACEAARKLARWSTNPAALIGATIDLPFACCFWQLFPAAGGGLGRCLSEGQVFRSRDLDYTVHYQFTCCYEEIQLLLWAAVLLDC